MADIPNFIVFITDQQKADMLGCAGDTVVKTPNIDDMALNGIRFDRFYVAMPSCMPNRSSIMTGQYPSAHGVRFNGIPLPKDSVTFPQVFSQNGYRTALVGKGHLQPILEPYDSARSTDWWGKELERRGADLTAPYYGYDEVSIVTGHGDGCGGHYEDWLKQRLPQYKDYVGEQNQLPHNYSCPQGVRTRLPEELYPTSYIAEQAIHFLEEHSRKNPDKPFLLVVSFPDPHHPFNPPGKYWDMYDPDDVQLPDNFAASDDGVPHLAAARRARLEQSDSRDGYGAVSISEREAREAIALTYGMITMVDDAIGLIRSRMETLGLADDTVQVFTSDHGDLLGDHGLMLKGPLHYQGLIRVPFILSDPKAKAANGVENRIFSSLDIGQTLLSRAGIPQIAHSHGLSIYDVLDDEREGRDALLIEDEYQSPVLCFDNAPVVRTLVTERWRLSAFNDASWGELYDLQNDPGEQSNLWSDPAFCATKADLLEKLTASMMKAVNRSVEPVSLA